MSARRATIELSEAQLFKFGPCWMAPAAVLLPMRVLSSDLKGCKIRTAAKGLNMGSGNLKYQMHRIHRTRYSVFTAEPA